MRPLLLLTALLLHGEARAAGYFVSEVGPKAVGRGGAFVVNPDDPTAMWLNPAGLSSVRGLQFYHHSSLVRLQSSFTRTCEPTCAALPYERRYGNDVIRVPAHPYEDPNVENGGNFTGSPENRDNLDLGKRGDSVGTVTNQSPFRWVPFVGMAMNGELIGIPGLGLGMAVYGPNTGGVKYDPNGLQRYTVVESVPLEALFEVAASYRFNRFFTAGLGLAFVSLGTEQRLALSLDRYGRETRRMDADVHVNVREDFIPTMILGFNSNPIDGLEFGGSFIPMRSARATGPFRVNMVDQTAVTEEQGVPIEFNDDRARAVINMGSPAVARAGVRYAFRKWFDVELAVVREFWSMMRYIRLDVQDLDVTALGQSMVLPPTNQAKEFRDTWSVRAGGDLHVIPGVLTTRAGAFVEESAIPDETLDVSVADGRKLGFASGFTLGYFGFRLTGAWQHIFIEPRFVDKTLNVSQNPITGVLGGGNTAVALGQYHMAHDVFSIGVTMDVGEVALRIKGAIDGDKNWWRPEGPRNGTLVDAGRWLQEQSNF